MEGCRGGCAQGNGPEPKDNVEADEPVRIVATMSTSFRFLAVACVGFSAAVSAFAAEAANAQATEKWRSLFDGKTLAGWMPSEFESGGAVKVENPFRGGPGAIVIAAGTTLSGFTWTKGGELPRENYEITLEAMKLTGSDFFCGLTFPVGKSACSLIVGGWGGMVIGLSNIDHIDASENETTQGREFKDGRWYRVRVRVSGDKIEAWIDDENVIDVEIKGRVISLRPGDIQQSLPLGVATYMTSAAVRDIRLRRL